MVGACSAATSTLTRIEVPSAPLAWSITRAVKVSPGQLVGRRASGWQGDQAYGGGRHQQAGGRTTGREFEADDGAAGGGDGLVGDGGRDQDRARDEVDRRPLADEAVELAGGNGLRRSCCPAG